MVSITYLIFVVKQKEQERETAEKEKEEKDEGEEEEKDEGEEEDKAETEKIKPSSAELKECNPFLLSKLVFVSGHVALKQLVHMEEVHKEKESQNTALQKTGNLCFPFFVSVLLMSFLLDDKKKEEAEKEAIEIELGVGSAAAQEEREAEWLLHVRNSLPLHPLHDTTRYGMC